MSDSVKILVFGSTGIVGKEVCASLARKKIPFRAAVTKLEKGDAIKSLGSHIEAVEVDVWKTESLEKALHGIEYVFLLSPPGQTHSAYGIVTAMKNAGVKYVVKLSALGAEDGGKGTFIWAVEHSKVEEAIKKEGIALTSLRPSSFMTNYFHKVHTIKNQSTINEGVDTTTKMNYIDPRDIGEVAATCLEHPTKYQGKSLTITGPDTLTYVEAAKIFSEELGKTITFVPLNDEEVRQSAKHMGMPEPGVEGWSNMWSVFRKGGYNQHSDDAENVIGRKLGGLRQWLKDNRNAFV